MHAVKFILTRILIWALVIWVGVSAVFFLPRMMPSDPVESMLGRLSAVGRQMRPEELEDLRMLLRKQFGLEGGLWEQYTTSIGRMLWLDFGPSFAMFPTPVGQLIGQYLPYSVGLMLFTTLISWIIGNGIGLLAGFKRGKWYSKVLETTAICIYPMPYFILALILLIVCCYLNNWFPLMSNMPSGFSFSRTWLERAFRSSFLPMLSNVLIGCGWWIISMKSLSTNVSEEEFVNYGRSKGLKEGIIAYRYVFRNSILTQVTTLALHLGGVFSGSLMTEIMFGYPGVGALIQSSILQNDYNMMLGLITISIIAVATTTLIIDIIYPFIDPRIRYN